MMDQQGGLHTEPGAQPEGGDHPGAGENLEQVAHTDLVVGLVAVATHLQGLVALPELGGDRFEEEQPQGLLIDGRQFKPFTQFQERDGLGITAFEACIGDGQMPQQLPLGARQTTLRLFHWRRRICLLRF